MIVLMIFRAMAASREDQEHDQDHEQEKEPFDFRIDRRTNAVSHW
jgi:hypothetical protein